MNAIIEKKSQKNGQNAYSAVCYNWYRKHKSYQFQFAIFILQPVNIST